MTSTAPTTAQFIEAHRHSTDAELAAALVEHAGGLALRMRAAGLSTDQKTSVSDVVTEADHAAEAFVAEALGALRADDGLLGEEGAARASKTGRTWVIDPVDGTYNFAQGSDYFCSAIALAEGDPADGNALIGAVHRPATGTTWLAAEGKATADGVELGGIEGASISEKALVTYLHPTFMGDEDILGAWLRAVRDAATIRMWGAGSVDLAGIASGLMGGWLQHSVADWDWLPGKALVEAVGGRATKVDAGGVTWCVAGSHQLVAEVEARLLGHDSPELLR
ncbi:inositol monophosphatase family protein [Corynebacterium sp. CNCTC7651]|uniref:inositol monophosphatase family protein n=1 Tax=Corynebacterium sp. CNCTC7651 TaxID=2815361 RepID=UPI001F16B026|nr:inositol monophosphatase family protein [Corynebacterium sp. CNCTC7651]UIZ92660.1 inositol monophosphatase family protein [Corynebacterium sp. CNCTC7651]